MSPKRSKLRQFCYIIFTLITLSCARQTTPEGGPKDTEKPVLIKSFPQPGEKNFKKRRIELYFSEDVKLKEPKEEIIITPSPGKEINFQAVGNRIIIEPKKPWLDSTTYNISFRESVQDITEGNICEDLHLAFSTGPTIDTLSISGTILEARKETIPEKITVALYQEDTFNIFKHTPVLFTKTDKKGNFKITNIHSGKYFVYAFEDKNKNLKAESTSEKYGFKKEKINVNKDVDSVVFQLINLDARQIKLNSNRSTTQSTTLRFNKPINSYKIDYPSKKLRTSFGDNQTEIMIYYDLTKQINDSLQIKLQATDSLNQHYDSVLYIKPSSNKGLQTQLTLSIETPVIDQAKMQLILTGKTNQPISDVNSDSIRLKIDSAIFLNFKINDIKIDSITKRFEITRSIDSSFFNNEDDTTTNTKQRNKGKPKPQPTLELRKGLLVSIRNDSSKQQTIPLQRDNAKRTSSLIVNVETKEKNYVIELLSNNNKVVASFRNLKTYTFTKLKADDYKIRIYLDQNQNQKWDIGNIYQRTEPEKTFFYKHVDGKYSFPIRENWEVGPYTIIF